VLFTPTEATVGETRLSTFPKADSAIQVFTFNISCDAYRQMRRFIETWIDRKTILGAYGAETFYKSTRDYTVVYSCHAFVLHALKSAGLKVRPAMGLWNGLAMREIGLRAKKDH